MHKEASDEQILNVLLHPHERLIHSIENLDVSRVSRTRSLDTAQYPLAVLGNNYEQYIGALESLKATINKGHTLTRSELNKLRNVIDEGSFFISDQGYIIDRHECLRSLFKAFNEFAMVVQIMHASSDRSRMLKHNLSLSLVVIEDMNSFVNRLTYVNNG